MNRMTGIGPYLTAACAVIALWAGGPASSRTATAPESTPRVTVTYANPQNFSENREFGMQNRYQGTDYLQALQAHLIKRATQMLPPGERLEVTITDIKLAGAYEPWRGPRMSYVRIMKDTYPPSIELTFKLIGTDGTVSRQGSRTLRNPGYLHSGLATPSNTDPLRYDKALLDSWLRRGPEGL
jgi:hypothetical protein